MKILKKLRLKNFKNPFKFFKPTKKRLVILSIILLIVIASYFFISRSNQPKPIQTVKAQSVDIKSTVFTSGSLTGKSLVDLKFKTGGKLAYVNVKQGDKVFAGQIIAGLDSQDLSFNLQQAQNSYRARQADVDKILDDIHLFQYGNGGFGNVGTKNETMTQRQLRTNAEVLRDNAYDNLKAAQREFQDTIIISPIDGLVTQSDFLPNQFVSPADLIASIVNDNEIFFDAEVDESEISKIQIGQNAQITLNAYPDKTFSGTVTEILPITKTVTSGATVVITRIALTETGFNFTQGLNGQASIVQAEASNSIVIPLEAMKDDTAVIIKKDTAYSEVKVTKGLESDTNVQILSGLEEGQEVVTNPADVDLSQKGSFLPWQR